MTSKFIWQIGEDWSITKVSKDNNKLFADAKATPVYAVLGNSQMLETDTVEMTCTINGQSYHKVLLHYAKTSNRIIVDDEAVAGWEVVSNGEELQTETSNFDVMTISFDVKRFSSVDGTTLLKNQPTGQTTENVYASDSYTPMVESSDAEHLEDLIAELNTVKQDKYDTSINTEEHLVVDAINDLITDKQDKYDENLATTNKTVVGAINELNDEIEGASGDVDAKIEEHNTSETAHQDIRNLIVTKQDQLAEAQLDAVNSGIDSVKVAQIETNKNNITAINGKIPAQASSENQLADKDFVNSSIATNTANFIGTFTSVELLESVGYLVIYSILKEDSVIAKGSVVNGTTYNHDTTLNSDLNITADSTLAFGSVIKSGSTIEIGSIINHETYESQTTSDDITIDTITNNDYANVINQELDFNTTTDMNAYDKTLLTNFDYAWIPNGTKYDLYRFDIDTQTWGLRATAINKGDVTLITAYNRYTFNGNTQEWMWNYTVNTSGFTASQWAAINSGATAEQIAKIGSAALTTTAQDLSSAINELNSALSNKQDIIQYSTMPTASVDNVGQIVQFTGTTGTYKNGFFYKCVLDNGSYAWEEIVFGTTLSPLSNAQIDTIMDAILV